MKMEQVKISKLILRASLFFDESYDFYLSLLQGKSFCDGNKWNKFILHNEIFNTCDYKLW